jgi:hypothetical protein
VKIQVIETKYALSLDSINFYHLNGSPLTKELEAINRAIVIFRYQITMMCYSMLGYKLPTDTSGRVLDCHHIEGIVLILSNDFIHAATLDNKSNLRVMRRNTHRDFHYQFAKFINYNYSDLCLFKYYFLERI